MKISNPLCKKLSSRKFIPIPTLRRSIAVPLLLCSLLFTIGCQNVPADNQKHNGISTANTSGDSIVQPAVQSSVLDRASDNSSGGLSNTNPDNGELKPKTRPETVPPSPESTPTDLNTTEESNDPPTDPEDDDFLTQLRALSEAEKMEMGREKDLADQVSGKTLAPDLYQEALSNEQKGDAEFQKGDQRGFLEAQKFYKAAKEDYKNAGKMAGSEQGSGLRQEAEAARSSMQLSKQKTGDRPELRSSSAYQNAEQYERLGESYMQQSNYAVAINAFQKAQTFFEEAANKAVNVTPPINPPPGESEAPSSGPAENELAEQRKIRSLMDKYTKGLETFDLNGLLASGFITRSEEKNWVQFFNNARDLKAEIDDENIELNNNQAQADFTVRISFFNTSRSKRENFQYAKKWQLESVNGNWKIISLK